MKSNNPSNKQLAVSFSKARGVNVTPRQISKSRKRGYLNTDDGIKIYKASPAIHQSSNKTGIQRNKGGGIKKWGIK